jgi:hypothetical protein
MAAPTFGPTHHAHGLVSRFTTAEDDGAIGGEVPDMPST